MERSASDTWSTTSAGRSTSTPSTSASSQATTPRRHLPRCLGATCGCCAGPESSAGRPMPDGRKPEPGGWNRIHFVVDDIDAEVKRLRDEGSASATTSSAAPVVDRYSSTIPPATRSRSSSRPPDVAMRRAAEPVSRPLSAARLDEPPQHSGLAAGRTSLAPGRGRAAGTKRSAQMSSGRSPSLRYRPTEQRR